MIAALERWNALPSDEAQEAVLTLCGSRAWAKGLASARPLAGRDEVLAAAEKCWLPMADADWEEAFAAHPRIGDRQASGDAGREQIGVRDASAATLDALALANREYEKRFGRVFLVCAAGRSASEMLALCRQRLQNEADVEREMAVEEQKKITRLRLERWLA